MKTNHTVALSFLGLVAIMASVGLLLVGSGFVNLAEDDGDNSLTGEQMRYAAAYNPQAARVAAARNSPPAVVQQIRNVRGTGTSSYVAPTSTYTSTTTYPSYTKYSSSTTTTQPITAKSAEVRGACCFKKVCNMVEKSKCGYWGWKGGSCSPNPC